MADKPTYEELEQRVQELDEEAVKRKQAEEALRESEERFRLLYERAPLSYQSLDEHGHLLEVNQAWLDTLGYTREEVIGKSFGDFLHPDWVDHFKQNFPRFKADGEIRGVEFEMMKKDGSLIMVDFNGKIGRDEKGDFKQTHCILQDITSKKTSEEALRESETKYRNIFNNAQVGISRTRISDGKILECNDRFARTYGYKTPEECKDDFVVSEHYTDPGTREKMLASLMEKGEVNNFEARFSRKDGDDVWIRFFARAYPEEGYLEGVGYDITEEKRALEALQKSEAQKKAILDGSIDVIRLVDKDMKIIWANKTTTTELKAAPEQLVGSFCYEAVAGRDTPCPGCPTKKALKSGKAENAYENR